MTTTTATDHQPDATQADNDAALARWQHKTNFVMVIAAVTPIALALNGAGDLILAAAGVASWAVFVVDLVVRRRLRPHYLRTGWGRADLAIVILTAPWFLIPGFSNTIFLGLLRLARVARIIIASHGLRRLFFRLSRVGIFAILMVLASALIVTKAESPADGFNNYGDGLWWAIVTITTVGYGDLVPQSLTGRITASILMISGIGIVGVLAGTLSTLFHLTGADIPLSADKGPDTAHDESPDPAPEPDRDPAPEPDSDPAPGPGPGPGSGSDLAALTAQVAVLTATIEQLTAKLDRLTAPPATPPPTD